MDSKNYKKSGGRDVIVSLVESTATITGDGTTSLEVGKWYVATSKATTSSGIDAFKIGRPFMAKTAISLAEGDNVEELTDFWDKTNIVGFANSKSLSFSKSSFDVTTDGDDYYDKITEEQVEVSGSFDGFKYLGVTSEDSAITKINRIFTDITIQTSEGDKVLERENKALYLVFLFSKTLPKSGDILDATFVPVYLTSNAENAAYSSGNTQNISFEGAESSEFGGVTAKSVVEYV